MSKEMFDIEKMYKCIRRFQDLGTGRDRRRILVGDSDDARTSTFSFVGDVDHNWPSWNEVRIRVGNAVKIFYTATQTIHGKSANIFFWNELTEDLWFQQVERQKLVEWIETAATAEPPNFIGMAELILELTESGYRLETYPGFARVNLPQIRVELRKLPLPALRKLNSLIGLECSADLAKSATAA
jgi:hypothetical protein